MTDRQNLMPKMATLESLEYKPSLYFVERNNVTALDIFIARLDCETLLNEGIH
jgi:hypothetical protein